MLKKIKNKISKSEFHWGCFISRSRKNIHNTLREISIILQYYKEE